MKVADTVPAAEFVRNFGRYKMQAQREAVLWNENDVIFTVPLGVI